MTCQARYQTGFACLQVLRRFEGVIPQTIQELVVLLSILRLNGLQGYVPMCFSILDDLEEIYLTDNRLAGMMPLI